MPYARLKAFRVQVARLAWTQRAQYPLNKENSFNYRGLYVMISGIVLN